MTYLFALQDNLKKHKVVILAGSGSSIDSLPAFAFKDNFVISLNWSFLYVPATQTDHFNYISDFSKEKWIDIIKTMKLVPPVNIFGKHDFTIGASFQLTKDFNTCSSACGSGFRGLDLAYKLQPEVIILAGIDLKGCYAEKVKPYQIQLELYDRSDLDFMLNQEAEGFIKAIKQIRAEGIKVINISKTSRIPFDITYEDFINGE